MWYGPLANRLPASFLTFLGLSVEPHIESRLISRSIAIGETVSGVVEHLGVLATHIDGDVGSRFTGALDFVGGDVGGDPLPSVWWIGWGCLKPPPAPYSKKKTTTIRVGIVSGVLPASEGVCD